VQQAGTIQRGARIIGDAAVITTPQGDRVAGQINLDFDRGGRLIGIEVVGASRRAPI